MPAKFKPKPLSEQTIVITGATSRIGATTARMAALKGANVSLASENESALNSLVEELTKQGGNVIGVCVDISHMSDLENLRIKTIDEFGSIDTWINNASTSLYGYLINTSLQDERKLFDINFWGTRMGSRIAVKEMQLKGGVIINIGSEVSVAAQPLLGIYSASKHALKAFTEALRSELRDQDIPIEVCLIRPTALDTPFDETGKNKLNEESPDLVAESILRCAENPQRDVYVGGPARLSAIIDTFFPQVKDMMTETRMKELKQECDPAQREEDESGQLISKGVMKTLKDNVKSSLREFRKEDGH